MNRIEVAVRHRFERFELDVEVRAPGDGVTALFGPSGAGKSTVIDTVSGLFRPQWGRVRIDGETLLDTGSGVSVPVHRRRIGYVFQDARLFPHLTVRDNCEYGARRAPERPSSAQVGRVIELLDLGTLLDRYPARLSGGERQRVAIARALLSAPRLLLLDEPLASLDAARKQEVLPYLESLQASAGLPVLLVSHALEEVARLAQHVVVLADGRVRAAGPASRILARPDLFPVHGPIEAGAVLEGRVLAHHDEDGLSEVAVGDATLWLARLAADPGAEVRLRVLARDVMVALERPRRISANNILDGRVAALGPLDGPWVEVQIDCGAGRLLASITRRSLARLDLAEGREVCAIVKSVNLAG